MNNLTLNVTCNYAYVSDPPIFADIGEAYIGIDTMDFIFNISSFFLLFKDIYSKVGKT